MKRAAYFRTQLRCMLRALPAVLLLSLLLFFATASISAALLRTDAASEERRVVMVGIVGDTEGSYLGFGFAVLTSLDSSRFSINFIETDLTEAEEALRRGELDGYLLIPDGFVSSIVNGTNKPIAFFTPEDADAVGTLLMQDVAKVVSALITESQSAMFGFERYVWSHAPKEAEALSNRLNLQYITAILTRQNASSVELLGISDGLDTVSYYLCAGVTLFLLLLGLSCCFLFVRSSYALPRMLAARGTGAMRQVFSEICCCFFLFLFALAVLILPAGLLASSGNGIVSGITPAELFRFFIGAMPAAAALAAMQFFLFECTSGIVGAALLQFAVGIGSAYLSGCFYPSYFFPEPLQRVAALTPAGVAFAQLRHSLAGSSNRSSLPLLLFWIAVFFWLAVLVRRARIGGKEE